MVIVIGAAAATVVVGGAVFVAIRSRLGPHTTPEQWAHAAYSIWTGGEDCGTWNQSRARSSLDSWYGVKASGGFWQTIRSLRQGTTDNAAWDQVRALDLVRIGLAAGYLDEEECWEEVRSVSRDLQDSYTSWEHLAREFEVGMQLWQDRRGVSDTEQRGRVQGNLPYLRETAWPSAEFRADLG